MLALAKVAVQSDKSMLAPMMAPKTKEWLTDNGWALFSSFSWAFVMYLFRWYPEAIQSSLRSSMVYM